MSSAKPQTLTVDVFAVCEGQDGRHPGFIDQAFKLHITHLSSVSVYFRLSITIANGDSNNTVVYLQIKPDHLVSLRAEFCRLNDGSSPYLDDVRRALGGNGDLTRLRFQLRRGDPAQIIVPKDFTGHEAPDGPARRTFDFVASLAASLSFCLYLPRNKLPKRLLNECVRAVEQFSELEGDNLRAYLRKVDPKRLYGGKGGKVLAPSDYEGSSRPDGERNRSSTPVTTDSCATTVDFDIVPRHQGSPPQYGECVTEGEKPRLISDATNLVKGSVVDCPPPEYRETEQPPNVPTASKRVRQDGNEDDLLHPSCKRLLSQDSFTTTSTTASMTDTRRPETKPIFYLDDAGVDNNTLLRNLVRRVEQQEEQMEQLRQEQRDEQLRHKRQMKQLQDEVEELRKQTTNLEGRHHNVEDICDNLEHRQGLAQEDLENLDVHIGELEEFCDKLEKQMPNISDELEDLVRDKLSNMLKEYMSDLMMEHLGDLLSEYLDKGGEGNLAEPLREYVRKNITAQMATMKAKLREALQE